MQRRQFELGPSAVLDLQKILANPRITGIHTVGDLRHLIAPLICRNKEEQDKFYEVFDEFLKEEFLASPQTITENDNETVSQDAQLIRRKRLRRIIWVLAFGASAILAGGIFCRKSHRPIRSAQISIQGYTDVSTGETDTLTGLLTDTAPSHLYSLDWYIDSIVYKNTRSIRRSFHTVGLHKVHVILREGNRQLTDTSVDVNVFSDTVQYVIPKLTNYARSVLSVQQRQDLVKKPVRRPHWGNLLLWGLLVLLLPADIVYSLVYFQRRKRGQGGEGRTSFTGPYRIEFPTPEELPGSETAIRQLADILRKRQISDAPSLDIPRSIRQTIEVGGFPSLSFSPKTQSTNFLFLIDREYPDSHLTRLFEYLATLLKKEQVSLTVYYYYKEPLFFDSPALNHEHLPVNKIIDLYPGAILFLLTDANSLFSFQVPVLKDKIHQKLLNWETRFIFTPVPAGDWGNKEKMLTEAGYSVVPADLNSHMLIEEEIHRLIRLERPKADAVSGSYSVRFLNMLEWQDLENYLRQATGYLYAAYGYPADYQLLKQWLCALAIYTRPDWNLTLAIGSALQKKFISEGRCRQGQLVNYSSLLVLSRISWMQTGQWNEVLKLKMLEQLDTHCEAVARGVLIEMLNRFEASRNITAHSLISGEFHLLRTVNRFLLNRYDPVAFELAKDDYRRMKYYVEEQFIDWSTDTRYSDPANPIIGTTLRRYFFVVPAFVRHLMAGMLFLLLSGAATRWLESAGVTNLVSPEQAAVTRFIFRHADSTVVIDDPIIQVANSQYIAYMVDDTLEARGLPYDTTQQGIVRIRYNDRSYTSQVLTASFKTGFSVYDVTVSWLTRPDTSVSVQTARPGNRGGADMMPAVVLHTGYQDFRVITRDTTRVARISDLGSYSNVGKYLEVDPGRATNFDLSKFPGASPAVDSAQSGPDSATTGNYPLLPGMSEAKSAYNVFKPYEGKIVRSISVRDYPPYNKLDSVADLTKDYVSPKIRVGQKKILNAMTTKPGKPINAQKLANDEQRIQALNYTQDARILVTYLPDNPDSADLVVILKERPTRKVSRSSLFSTKN